MFVYQGKKVGVYILEEEDLGNCWSVVELQKVAVVMVLSLLTGME